MTASNKTGGNWITSGGCAADPRLAPSILRHVREKRPDFMRSPAARDQQRPTLTGGALRLRIR